MSDELNQIKQMFVEKWLMDVTQIFRSAVLVNPALEEHFNKVTAGECAQELLEGLTEDLERYEYDLDSENIADVGVRAELNEGGAFVYVDFQMLEPRLIH